MACAGDRALPRTNDACLTRLRRQLNHVTSRMDQWARAASSTSPAPPFSDSLVLDVAFIKAVFCPRVCETLARMRMLMGGAQILDRYSVYVFLTAARAALQRVSLGHKAAGTTTTTTRSSEWWRRATRSSWRSRTPRHAPLLQRATCDVDILGTG